MDILQNFCCNLDEDQPVIVTDRGSNMIAAFKGYDHIQCVNHLLQNIIEETVKKIIEFSEMVDKCSKLVKFFKKSGSNFFFKCDVEKLVPNTMEHSFLFIEINRGNWIEISNTLKEKNQTHRIESIHINELTGITRVLETFSDISKNFESSPFPTIHFTIPYINKLKKACQPQLSDSDLVSNIKSTLLQQITQTILPYVTKFHKIALFLFPPTNKLLQFSEVEKKM